MSELEYEDAIMPWIMEVEDVEAAWLNPSWWRGLTKESGHMTNERGRP